MSSLEDLDYQQRDELAKLSKTLADNPHTRKAFLRLTKQVNPDLVIPELDIEENTNTAIEKMMKENESIRNQLRERDARDNLEKRRANLKTKGMANTDQDIEEIEKVMLEKNIPDHETAAQYWDWMKQSATPTPTGYNPSGLGKFDLSQYWKNPQGAARNEAAKALSELRKNTRPIGI